MSCTRAVLQVVPGVVFPAHAAIALAAWGPGRVGVERMLRVDEISIPVVRAAIAAPGAAAAAWQLRWFWPRPTLARAST